MMKHPLLITASVTLVLAACGVQPEQEGKPVQESLTMITVPPATEAGQHEDESRERSADVIKPKVKIADHQQRMFAERAMVQSTSEMKLMRQNGGGTMFRKSWIAPQSVPPDRENYAHFNDNQVQAVAQQPLSTFSIDVDTGSYSNLRRMLQDGRLPRQDAVRVEEMLNYFRYQDARPKSLQDAFNVTAEVGPNPWNRNTHLLRINLNSWQPAADQRSPANLVFLIDVSGSMNSADKLPLLKKSLLMLTRQLTADDKVSMVVYAGASGVVLEPTAGNDYAEIEQALSQLQAGGSTNGASGIELAYAMAQKAFIKQGVNRVILATDGDFNVGTVNHQALVELIKRKRESGIALTTLGFGSGNFNDRLMEQLADYGDGNYAYIDSLMEAKKVLVDELGATLQTVARDVKIQLEFNPAEVSEYRLIGYENRKLANEDFNNDKVDAGEIGAGHSVTALYEISLRHDQQRLGDLRYQGNGELPRTTSHAGELALIKLRYKPLDSDESKLKEFPIVKQQVRNTLAQTSDDYRFASAVAAFGQLLRGGKYLEQFGYADVIQLAQAARGSDERGMRSNFVQLVGLSSQLAENGDTHVR